MFSDPSTIIPQLHISPGSSVADLGSGIGAYSLVLARIVGPSGKVYSCDVQKDLLIRLDNEAKAQGISNIQTVHSNIETTQGSRLRDASVDWVVIANVLFQSEDRAGLVAEAARILKPSGKVVLIEWSDSFGNIGPHEKDIVSKVQAEKLFSVSHLSASPLIIDAGGHHYGIIFNKTS